MLESATAARGERYPSPGRYAAPGSHRRHVTGILQLAQVRDQVARREPDELLEPRKGQILVRCQRRQRHHDAQPGRRVNHGVEVVITHARSRPRWNPTPASRPAIPHTPTGPAYALDAVITTRHAP